MIAVIADDFTGAAEVAGISLRYGLTVELVLGDCYNGDSDVLVACTDSRSLSRKMAVDITSAIVRKLVTIQPECIFKKIDSVLRGYVVDEILAQVAITGSEKVLILPANPSLGRRIEGGEYLVEGKRITDTSFATDPEFPIKSSFVKQMIGNGDLRVLRHRDPLPNKGMVLAESATLDDVKSWAGLIDESWTAVGAGDFYAALLNKRFTYRSETPMVLGLPHLYVCGTAIQERKSWIKNIDKEAGCVVYLPNDNDSNWLEQVSDILRKQRRLILAIDESNQDAVSLRKRMAAWVKAILSREEIHEVFIEGGSTAAAVLKELELELFAPVNELQRGVVRMQAGKLFVTVKPGSYQLPKEIEAVYHDPKPV